MKSNKSSDNSSSGHASDQELISSRNRGKNKESMGYEPNRNGSNSRPIDKVPKEMRVSKQSFCQAMENPCEFFVDVM